MADNYAFTPGTGSIGASDDIGGVQFPRVKTTWGPDGTANDADVASGKPLPVQLRGSDGTDRSNLLPVSAVSAGGTVTIAGSVTVAAGTLTAVTGITNTVTIAGAAANAGGTVTVSGALPAGTNAIGTVTVLGSISVGALTGGTTTAIGGGGTITIAAGTLTAVTAITNTVTIAGSVTLSAGTNAIGTVTISPAQLAPLSTTTLAMSAGYQLTSLPSDMATLAVAADTARLLNGASGTSLTPKFAKTTASSSGTTTIVAAVTSKKLRVIAWEVVANAAVNFKWQSAGTTDLTGLYYMAGQGGGVARAYNPVGYFETISGEALSINLSGAVAVGGSLVYVEV